MLHFTNVRALLLLGLIPLLVWRYLRRVKEGDGSLLFGSTIAFEGVHKPWTVRFRHVLFAVKMVALGLAVLALAQPQEGTGEREMLTECSYNHDDMSACGCMGCRERV